MTRVGCRPGLERFHAHGRDGRGDRDPAFLDLRPDREGDTAAPVSIPSVTSRCGASGRIAPEDSTAGGALLACDLGRLLRIARPAVWDRGRARPCPAPRGRHIDPMGVTPAVGGKRAEHRAWVAADQLRLGPAPLRWWIEVGQGLEAGHARSRGAAPARPGPAADGPGRPAAGRRRAARAAAAAGWRHRSPGSVAGRLPPGSGRCGRAARRRAAWRHRSRCPRASSRRRRCCRPGCRCSALVPCARPSARTDRRRHARDRDSGCAAGPRARECRAVQHLGLAVLDRRLDGAGRDPALAGWMFGCAHWRHPVSAGSASMHRAETAPGLDA